ncbi:acetyltransferase, partial [Sphingomonas sp. BHC-A]
VKARDTGLSPGRSAIYGTAQGAVELATEKIPVSKLIGDLAAKTPLVKTFMRQIASEAPREVAATLLQNFNEWATINPDKPFKDFAFEQPMAALETVVQTVGGVGATVGVSTAAERTTRIAANMLEKRQEAARARAHGAFLDQVAEATGKAKTTGRSPDAVSDLVQQLGDDTGNDRVFISSNALRAYEQSDGYSGEFDSFRDAVDEAYATGGDLVLPIGEVTKLAATPAWGALKNDMRLSPGGMSVNEAQTFEDSMADVMDQLSEQAAQEREAERAAQEPRQRLQQSIADKLMNAGFTPATAMQQAELLAQRETTRAARMGRELTGQEFDPVEVRQILPPALAQIQAADSTDILIETMKGGKDARTAAGPSLMDFIARGGGIVDTGGDLRAMGADQWHRGKPGKRKLVKDQGELIDEGGLGQNEYGADAWAQRAWEAGYFPEFGQDRPTANDLLDAISEGVSGRDRFLTAKEKTLRDAAQELRGMLENRGIDPDTASRKEIKDAIAAYQQESEGQAFDQAYNDGPRGRIVFPSAGFGTGPSIIELFQSRDQSTFLHETGHLWLEQLRADAMEEGAPDQLKADWQQVQDWFAVNGHPLADGTIPTDAHELWARGVERYLMEGKAPTPLLRRAFEQFKAWLVAIYRATDRLKAPITPEIRSVMDRLIATDEEIEQARQIQNIEALFTEQPATMTDEEFAAYQASTEAARGEAHDALLAKVMNAVKRRVTKEYNDRRAAVEADVSAQIDARPEFRALRQARETPLDSTWIREALGEDAPGMLPKAVPPIHKEGGVNPDEVAELSGFTSGDEMVRALMGVETARRQLREGGDKRSVRKALIDQEVDTRMMERYGDPFTDGSIEEEALAIIHNDQQGEVIAAEMRVLARSTGQRVTPYRIAKDWAARSVRSGKVADVASRSMIQRYQRAAAKAGKAAMDAVIAGDNAEAFRQKQAQMLNNALVSEAKRAADEVEAAVKRMDKVASRRTLETVDQDYLERAQGLLEQVDLKQRSQRFLDRQESFEAWAREQEEAGRDMIVPPSFSATLGTTNWSRLTVEQLLGLDAAVKQIMHLGRLKQKLLDAKEERDYEAVVGEALAAGDGMKRRPPSDLLEPDWKGRISANVAAFDAALLKMEQVFDWLDQGNSHGVFNRIVFAPISEAQDRENSMLADYYGRIKGAFDSVGKSQLRRWSQSFSSATLSNPETGNPLQMTRQGLIAIALNMGNAGNTQRLVDGYRWNEGAVRELLNRELAAEDWAFVQQVWDIVETLWPETAALERRVNGVEPDKVEAVPVVTPHGTLRGGYYPAIYDSARSQAAEYNEGRASEMFGMNYTRANPRASSTKDRANAVKRPILLQIGVINRHLGEVIHDITHREAIMQADKFLSDSRISKMVDETVGPEIRKQFRPWLKFIANQWGIEKAGNEGVGKFIGKARANTTIVGMGFRATTILTQIAGYSNSVEYVGAKWIGQALAQTTASPIDTFNFVMEKSGEVRNRMDTLDRDLSQVIKQMAGESRVGQSLTAAKRFAFHGIGYADRLVVIPTWIGAYNKALAEGAQDGEAVYAADKAVRLAQGAGSAKDLAAIQRGTGKWGEFLKLSTMFYSYMSAVYQRQRTLGRDLAASRSPRDLPNIMARAFWLMVLPPVMSQILSGNGPGEDDDWGVWTFKQMLFQMLGPLPVVRDLARPIWDAAAGNQGFDYQISPIQRAGQTLVEIAKDAHKIATGDETKRATRNLLEGAGYVTGLVPGQFAASAQFLVDVGEGEQAPETFTDWWEGITTGKVKED